MKPTAPQDSDPLLASMQRRQFLQRCGLGFGALTAMAFGPKAGAMLAAPRARAKKIIYLHMSGGPPGLDLFDYKPKLVEFDRTPCPKEFIEGKRLAFIKGHPVLLGPPHGFRQVGKNGSWVTELMPHFEKIADEVCMIHSMHTDQFNHAPAELLLHTGTQVFGGASIGSWVLHGLGSMNPDLPAFVVMLSGPSDPTGGKSLWGSGFLPSHLQGTLMRAKGDPVLYVSNPAGMDRQSRRSSLDALAELNRIEHARSASPDTLSRLEQYELAYRMQSSVPEAMDISQESAEVIERYGAQPGAASFANNCLLARRLVERDVRFVQLYDWGWDLHGTSNGDDLMESFPKKCKEVDQPIAALILDLKERGLLDETLVIWGGEFGRTPMNEARDGSVKLGRDHHPDCFTLWMAGGGVRSGLHFGQTDELGYSITQNPVSVRDLQATILHIMGLDPFQMRYPYLGLDQRLIGPDDAAAKIRPELLS
jgi:uncharacterized protein DUF1501